MPFAVAEMLQHPQKQFKHAIRRESERESEGERRFELQQKVQHAAMMCGKVVRSSIIRQVVMSAFLLSPLRVVSSSDGLSKIIYLFMTALGVP